MPEKLRNVGASVRARLQNLSRETGQSFELILTRYALERLLYRLGTSLENVALHPGSLADVIAGIAGFIMPHAIAAAKIGRSR